MSTDTADLLAATCESQRVQLHTYFEEQQRAFDALDSAGQAMLRGSEEVGDGICRLAGERDRFQALHAQGKAMLDDIAKALGVQPDPRLGHLPTVQRVLQYSAKLAEQTKALAQLDAGRRAVENLLAEKNARIAELEQQNATACSAIDAAMERLRAA